MIELKDIIQIGEDTSDGYGDKTVVILTDIEACFLQGSGNTHSNNTDIANSDAHAYLDIYNEVLVERGFKIEGLYIIANPLGSETSESWYRIERVKVGQRKLIDNSVDNVHVWLKKVAKPKTNYVS